MRWEFFFVLFLDDDDDVGATWESDNFFTFRMEETFGWIETLVKTHTKREQNRPKKKGRPR